MKKTLLTLATIAGLSQSAIAGPDATVKKFMNQHVSLLDWGMFHVQNDVERNLPSFYGPMHTNVYYDFERNEIVINIYNTQQQSSEDGSDEKQTCKAIVNAVRERAGVDSDTGQLVKWAGKESFFADKFTNNGFEFGNIQKELPTLDKKFLIRVYYKEASCSGALVSRIVNHQE
jgi:hypothetical protein